MGAGAALETQRTAAGLSVEAFLQKRKPSCRVPACREELGARLYEIAETVAAKQEKMLVFTQFQKTTAPLSEAVKPVKTSTPPAGKSSATAQPAVKRTPRKRNAAV